MHVSQLAHGGKIALKIAPGESQTRPEIRMLPDALVEFQGWHNL